MCSQEGRVLDGGSCRRAVPRPYLRDMERSGREEASARRAEKVEKLGGISPWKGVKRRVVLGSQ